MLWLVSVAVAESSNAYCIGGSCSATAHPLYFVSPAFCSPQSDTQSLDSRRWILYRPAPYSILCTSHCHVFFHVLASVSRHSTTSGRPHQRCRTNSCAIFTSCHHPSPCSSFPPILSCLALFLGFHLVKMPLGIHNPLPASMNSMRLFCYRPLFPAIEPFRELTKFYVIR